MAATCLVCGERADSYEHLFPAVLGGRQKTGRIYCRPHNHRYGALVAEIERQLEPLNAQLGVVSDNRREDGPQATTVAVPGLDTAVSLSTEKALLQAPVTDAVEVITGGADGDEALGERRDMRVTNQRQKDLWVAEQRRAQRNVHIVGQGEPGTTVLPSRILKGTDFGGLRASAGMAYIAQTYLASLYPELARDVAFRPFIQFTHAEAQLARVELDAAFQASQRAKGEALKPGTTLVTEADVADAQRARDVAQRALPGDIAVSWGLVDGWQDRPNAFAFGHRVVIGMDATDGLVYAQVSLFATVHYRIAFGHSAAVTESREVCIDINPLERRQPHDQLRMDLAGAAHRFDATMRAALPERTDLQAVVNALGQRMHGHVVREIAQAAVAAVDSSATGEPAHDAQLLRVLAKQLEQLVWNLIHRHVEQRRRHLAAAGRSGDASTLASLFAFQATAANGMTPYASQLLAIATSELAVHLQADHVARALTADRLEALLLGSAGESMIATAISPSLNSLVGA